MSKYGTTGELFATLRDNSKVWVPHERLGRLAASFFPLFLNSSEEEHYKKLLADTLNAGLRETLRARSPLRRRRVLAFALVVDALRLRNVRFEKKKGPRPIGERPNHPGDVCGGGRRVVDANVDRVGAARQARHERKWNTGSNDQSFYTGYPQPAHNLTVRTISAFTRSHERSCAAILQLVLRVSFTRYRDVPMRRIVSNSLSARRRNARSREAAGGPRRSLPEDGLEKVRHSGAVGEPRPRFARQRTFVARGIWRLVPSTDESVSVSL